MPVFKPITTEAQLPLKWASFERSVFDLKSKHPDPGDVRTHELAKHMAAFSNAMGGVILLDYEENNGALGSRIPLTPEEAGLQRGVALSRRRLEDILGLCLNGFKDLHWALARL